LERCNEVKDNNHFNNHYDYIITKAFKVLSFVIRNTKDFNIDTIIKLYTSLVRPHLEINHLNNNGFFTIAYADDKVILQTGKL